MIKILIEELPFKDSWVAKFLDKTYRLLAPAAKVVDNFGLDRTLGTDFVMWHEWPRTGNKALIVGEPFYARPIRLLYRFFVEREENKFYENIGKLCYPIWNKIKSREPLGRNIELSFKELYPDADANELFWREFNYYHYPLNITPVNLADVYPPSPLTVEKPIDLEDSYTSSLLDQPSQDANVIVTGVTWTDSFVKSVIDDYENNNNNTEVEPNDNQ